MASKSSPLNTKSVICEAASVIDRLFEKHRQAIESFSAGLGAIDVSDSEATLEFLSQQIAAVELSCSRLDRVLLSVEVADCSHWAPALLVNAGSNQSSTSSDARIAYMRTHAIIGFGVSVLLKELLSVRQTGARVLFLSDPRASSRQNGRAETISDGVNALYGIDLNSSLAPGNVGLKTGPIFSSRSRFNISLTCENAVSVDQRAAHDLIQVASRLSIALHQAGSRQIDPLTPVTVSLSGMNSGEDSTTGLSQVHLAGMFRSMDDSLNGQIEKLIQSTIEGVANHRTIVHEVEVQQSAPVIFNDRRLKEYVAEIAADLLGAQAVREPQYQGSEDDCLAEFYRSIPGVVLQVGTSGRGAFSSQNLESNSQQLRPSIEAAVKILSLAMCGVRLDP